MSLLFLLILLFLLSNQSNWIIFLISLFVFFRKYFFRQQFSILWCLWLRFFHPQLNPVADQWQLFFSTRATFLCSFLSILSRSRSASVPSSELSQQRCFQPNQHARPTRQVEWGAGGKHKILFMISVNKFYVFRPFSFAANERERGSRNSAREVVEWVERNGKIFQLNKHSKVLTIHTTHPNLGSVSVAVRIIIHIRPEETLLCYCFLLSCASLPPARLGWRKRRPNKQWHREGIQ